MIQLSCLRHVKRTSEERPPVPPYAHLVSINVDKSGSMASFCGAQVSQIYEMILVLKAAALEGNVETLLSIWTFDGTSHNPIETLDLRSAAIPSLGDLRRYFKPGGMTALYRSSKACVEQLVKMRQSYIVSLSTAVKRLSPDIKATYYLMTDGEDTASSAGSRMRCIDAMRHARNVHGVKDIFLGANIDAKTTATSMGFRGPAIQMAPTPEGCNEMMKTVTSLLRATSQGSAEYYNPVPTMPPPPSLPDTTNVNIRPLLRRY
tara:strand:+ start:1572 stop:2357 length:786 start_codon:yes stop_codon:yes gene_type:complete